MTVATPPTLCDDELECVLVQLDADSLFRAVVLSHRLCRTAMHVLLKKYTPKAAMRQAAERGLVAAARRLLDDADASGLVIDAPLDDADASTALHVAAAHGHVPLIHFLLRRGARKNGFNKSGFAPLQMACAGGHIEAARTLLSAGAEATVECHWDLPPLHAAVKRSDMHGGRVLRTLLAAGAPVDWRDLTGRTALLAAAQDLRVGAMQALLAAGADANLGDDRRDTPWFCACFPTARGNEGAALGAISLLAAAGVDVDRRRGDGKTALHVAAWQGATEIIRALLRHGAAVDKTASCGSTALHLSCDGFFVDCAAALLEGGASPTLARAADGCSTLDIVRARVGLCYKNEGLERLLEAAGNRVWPRHHARPPPEQALSLHDACRGCLGVDRIRELLAQPDTELEAADAHGMTPLHVAAASGRAQVVLALLHAGADPRARTPEGRLALQLAQDRGSAAVVRLLTAATSD